MRTAAGIFWHDLKQLARNPLALLVVIGLIVLPSVYAWYSIAAMWSPYSNTGGLKVAVVNNDEGMSTADIKGIKLTESAASVGQIDIGSLLIEAMAEDDSLDWQFVDAQAGQTGLESGEYYAEFVIPESFSADFFSVLSGTPTNPTIGYWVNEKYNAVALEVTDAGAGVVDALINRVFSGIVANAMTDIVKDVASGLLEEGSATASQARVGLTGAANDLQAVETGLRTAGDSIDKWATAADDASATLGRLKKTVPDARAAIEDAGKVLADVRAVSHEVASTYASALAEGGPELSKLLEDVARRVKDTAEAIDAKQPSIDSAMKKAERALDECEGLIEALKKADPESETIGKLEKQTSELRDQLDEFESARDAIANATSKASKASDEVSKEVETALKNLRAQGDAFNRDVLPQLDASLDAVALVLGSLDGALIGLDAQVDQADELLGQLDDVLDQVKEVLEETSDSLEGALDSLKAARTDLSTLSGSHVATRLADLVNLDAKTYGAFMASPVTTELKAVYPLNSYGAGVAPFYTNLALWVGCFMLIAILKLEVDPKRFPGVRPWQGYVGRFMLLVLLALLQAVVVTAGDMLIGVEAFGPVSFVVAGLATAFCFVSIVFALAVTFKHIGKALAVIFLIVQIPGASGMYPVELMPGFFQSLYPFLPFTYGMGAMREALGGFYGNAYLLDLAWLLACGLAALAIALIVRPALLNVNSLLDKKLRDADIYITEEYGLGSAVNVDRPFLAALLESAEGRAELNDRAEAFGRRYAIVKQAAPLAVVAFTVALFLLSMLISPSADDKLAILAVYIAAVVVVFCACVAFEYARDNLQAVYAHAGIRADYLGDETVWEDVNWLEESGGETAELTDSADTTGPIEPIEPIEPAGLDSSREAGDDA